MLHEQWSLELGGSIGFIEVLLVWCSCGGAHMPAKEIELH
jgi:hypothetical protein